MKKYEQEKWREELVSLLTKPNLVWEDIVGNVGVFFLQRGRIDIAQLLFEFVCQCGEFTLVPAFNLSNHYLTLAKYFTKYGTTAASAPVDVSQSPEGSFHPDSLVNALLKRKEMLEHVE
jgi:hypothetical protein